MSAAENVACVYKITLSTTNYFTSIKIVKIQNLVSDSCDGSDEQKTIK